MGRVAALSDSFPSCLTNRVVANLLKTIYLTTHTTLNALHTLTTLT